MKAHKILDSSVMSIFLYGCESCFVMQSWRRRSTPFSLDCYRAVLGLTRLDRINSEVILNTVNIPPLIGTVRKRQLGWLGHVMRRGDDEPAKIFALYKPERGTRKRGRPVASYSQQVPTMLGFPIDLSTPARITEIARNKEKWSKITAAQERI
jgi:hypothetical protein